MKTSRSAHLDVSSRAASKQFPLSSLPNTTEDCFKRFPCSPVPLVTPIADWPGESRESDYDTQQIAVDPRSGTNAGKDLDTVWTIFVTDVTVAGSSADGCSPQINVTFMGEGTGIYVESTKDLSNVVIEFADGTHQKFDDLDQNPSLTGTGGKYTNVPMATDVAQLRADVSYAFQRLRSAVPPPKLLSE